MRKLAVVVAGALVLSAPGLAGAEPFLAVFGGAAFTRDADVDTRLDLDTLTFLDGTLRDVRFDTAAAFGGKAGYFFERPLLGGHVGLELEVAHFGLDVSEQTVRFTGTSVGQPVDTEIPIQEVEVDVTTVGLHALYRLPVAGSPAFPAGRLQPYVGLGLDLWVATFSTVTTPLDVNRDVSDTDVQPALQALAGVKWFLTRQLALFAEYKFLQTATLSFTSRASGTRDGAPVREVAVDEASLTSHVVVGGIAFHW
ncbi:MAG: outer membrane protein [Candidatus Rokuibacteriota bacterium]